VHKANLFGFYLHWVTVSMKKESESQFMSGQSHRYIISSMICRMSDTSYKKRCCCEDLMYQYLFRSLVNILLKLSYEV
jgi:hypothetical protein